MANRRGHLMRQKKVLFRYDGERLAGRTNRVDFQLTQALRATFLAPAQASQPSFPAHGKEHYVFELTRLDVPEDPLVLVRVYEGFAEPEASGAVELEVAERPLYPVNRKLSSDGRHGPVLVKRRSPLRALDGLRALEAFARLGTLEAAADELGVDPRTILRRMRALEASTDRTLLKLAGRRLRLTPAARQVARATTTAFDLLEAAARPQPPGRTRGRPKPASAKPD